MHRADQSQLEVTAEKLASCQDNPIATPPPRMLPLPVVVARVTGGLIPSAALQDDRVLRAALIEASRALLETPRLTEAAGRERLNVAEWGSEEGWDTAWLLSWMAQHADVQVRTGPGGALECTRGPLGLSHRQALHLGIDAHPDADLSGHTGAGGVAIHSLSPEEHCGPAEESDWRTRTLRVLPQLRRALDPDSATDPQAPLLHLGAVLAAALEQPPEALRLPLSVSLEDPAEQAWLIDQAAQVLARAVVLPCEAALAPRGLPRWLGDDEVPGLTDCLMLHHHLQR